DRCVNARLTRLPQIRKCSRSPLHRAAASPLQQLRMLSELSALKMFWQRWARTPFCSDRELESEVQTAADHSEIVFWTIDHAEAQVVSPTDMPRDSEFETGSELTEHLGFATEMIGLRMDSEGIWRPLCVKNISLAAAEDRPDPGPCVGRQTCTRYWITQCKRS